MTNQQAPEIYALHTVPNKGERPWSGIYAVRADAEHDAKVLRDVTGRDWSVVRLVVADTATTPTGPVARYKISYATDDWGMRSSTPSGIPDHAGAWVRYEDHAAALCRLHAENEALRAQQDDAYDHGPQAETVEEAARDVGKWLNERPNRPLDLRHVAMLTHHAKRTAHVQNPAEIEHVAGDVSKNGAELNTSTQQPAPAGATPAESVERIVHLRAYRERRIYVAGPMTGLPEYNFPLFNSTAVRLRSEGWHVENPAEHGHVEGAGWADYLRWDISRIATCGAIYLLPGWSNSKGATLEVHIAGVLALEVLLADGAEAPTPQPTPAAGVTVEQVEDAIGLQSTAWDTIGAEKIVEAVLRLTNGQAPATQQAVSSAVLKAIREANMQLVRTGDNAFMLVPYKVATAQAAESVPAVDELHALIDQYWDIAYAEGQESREHDTEAGDAHKVRSSINCAIARLAARAPADSVLEDAARWHWLAEYLVGTRTDLDDGIIASATVDELRKLVDADLAAIKQGEKQ